MSRSYRYLVFFLLFAIGLVSSSVSTAAQNAPVTITVDAASNRHPINPHIYGVTWATTAELRDLNTPLNRFGGNDTSRYNWQLNASNHAKDWYFESIAKPSAVAGEHGDTFISNSKAANAQPMVTIPMLDWVAKLGPNRATLPGFSIAKYGPQTDNDATWFPDAGNGVQLNGQFIVGNDPTDAHVPSSSAFQRGWMQHLISKWGTSGNGGLRYYILDNEPSLWHETHRDVHPTGVTMDELKNRMIDYATTVKATDPLAVVLGPEEWGWPGYFLSGYDQHYSQQHGWGWFPDRDNHGGWEYLPWLLDQFRQHNAATGKRLLDVFTVHFYPQGGEFSDDVSPSMQERRNRSTRSMWDPNYLDESWINDRVQLVSRLKNWTSTYYPNTPVGVTEYNWGAENHINGATTQADILGIFGREGLDMAARWETPPATTPTYKAMKMYRNYDGKQSTFGDTNVSAVVPNPDTLAAFAAERSTDRALTMMVISKALSGDTATTINLTNATPGATAQVWQLTAANTITRLADVTVSGNSVSATLPPQSITLFVVAGKSNSQLPAAPSNLTATALPGQQLKLAWTDNAGNETGFSLERCIGARCGNFAPIATVGANVRTYMDTGLLITTTYSYRVRAYNSAGNSQYSNTASTRIRRR